MLLLIQLQISNYESLKFETLFNNNPTLIHIQF